jgi:hypothetical protein
VYNFDGHYAGKHFLNIPLVCKISVTYLLCIMLYLLKNISCCSDWKAHMVLRPPLVSSWMAFFVESISCYLDMFEITILNGCWDYFWLLYFEQITFGKLPCIWHDWDCIAYSILTIHTILNIHCLDCICFSECKAFLPFPPCCA